MLTEGNYSEWSWRISTVFISLGVGAGLLTMQQGQHDVSSENNHIDGVYVMTEPIRKMKAEMAAVKIQRDLSNNTSERQKLADRIKEIKKDLDEAVKAATDLHLASSTAKTPFADMSEKAMIQCFRILSSTISSDLDFLVMNFLPTQFEEAWFSVRDYFQTNTRGARMDAKIEFFQMTMMPEMKFAQFKNKIEFTSRRINTMADSTIINDEDKLTVLFRGLRRHHFDLPSRPLWKFWSRTRRH